MYETLDVEILTPSKSAFRGQIEWMTVKTTQGLMEVLPGHARMAAVLDIGLASIHLSDRMSLSIAVHGGIMQVDDDRVLILASEAEHPEEIDPQRAKDALKRAREELGAVPGALKTTAVFRVIQDRLRAEARLGAFQAFQEQRNGNNHKKGSA